MLALIIDDERHCREGLAIMLSKYCPGVEVLAECANAKIAIQAIEKFQPDLIFLDIEMPGMNGFEMLENCKDRNFEIIFTTAYNEYAIQAIRHSALDYLLKPVNKGELVEAVLKVNKPRQATATERISQLLELMETRKALERIALPTVDGYIIVDSREILYCESENNYTRFYVAGGKTFFVSKTLKKVEALLMNNKDFFRIHHSFLINLRYIQSYFKGDGGGIFLTNGKSLPVSRAKKQEFLDRLEKL
jgi:two-component system LytT family response regulator